MRNETPAAFVAAPPESDFWSALADRVLARGASVATAEDGAGPAALRGERAPAAPMP